MIKYKFYNNVHQGVTPEEVVEDMRRMAYTPYDSNEEYMKAVQRRVLIYNNNLIKVKDESEFLSELVRVNVLEKV